MGDVEAHTLKEQHGDLFNLSRIDDFPWQGA